ncbi:hypothetical protein [Halococcus agarilyticus]|uniref:hypothetical protein n=1 Tax=Halococcus agarilyticus TaxID=1232219 RepID=UPI000677EA16|nr:hypothetical protein [Halococcus agarilyticus]
MVFDTHTHAWGPPSEAHPWVTTEIMSDVEGYSVPPVYTTERLLADMDAGSRYGRWRRYQSHRDREPIGS